MSRTRRTKTPPSIHTAPASLDAVLAAHAAGDRLQFAVRLSHLTKVLGRTDDASAVRDEVLREAAERAARAS